MGAKNKYLAVIAGPTAIGKTNLAIHLARHYNTVVLSADSRQFYKELNIGTAKPSSEQLASVRHYFINTKSVGELYGAGHYAKDASQLLDGLFKTHSLIILVGGSGLYINALLNGVDDFEEVPAELRQKINLAYARHGLIWLQEELLKYDPVYYNTIDAKNPQRMIRALEVCIHSGKPFSDFLQRSKKARDYIDIGILLNTSRSRLYESINLRVDLMMENGLLDETRQLLPCRDFNALKTVGYKELFEHLDGKTTLAEAVEKIKQHTRNYAKRQITWFKNKGNYESFEPTDLEKIKAYIDFIMQHA